MIALVDTCILLDAMANRAPFAESAQELLLQGGEKRIELIVTAKTILDIHYLLKHSLHEEGMVRAIIAKLMNSCRVVDTSAAAIIQALSSAKVDYEDAVQIECALLEGADYIVTRDRKGYKDTLVPSVTAEQMLQAIA